MKKIFFAIVVLFTLLSINHTLDASAQTYVYQHGINGYSGTDDVSIAYDYQSGSYGSIFLVETNVYHAILKFDLLDLPAGHYSMTLQLKPATLYTNGNVRLRELKKRDWSEAGSDLNPPSTSSSNPTWNYQNYNTISWHSPGALGAEDVGEIIDTVHVDSTDTQTFVGEISIDESQSEVAFHLQGDVGKVLFWNPESAGVTANDNPKLILTRIESQKAYGGLDANSFFNPLRPLR